MPTIFEREVTSEDGRFPANSGAPSAKIVVVSGEPDGKFESNFESVTVVVTAAHDAEELASILELTSCISFELATFGGLELFVKTLTAEMKLV